MVPVMNGRLMAAVTAAVFPSDRIEAGCGTCRRPACWGCWLFCSEASSAVIRQDPLPSLASLAPEAWRSIGKGPCGGAVSGSYTSVGVTGVSGLSDHHSDSVPATLAHYSPPGTGRLPHAAVAAPPGPGTPGNLLMDAVEGAVMAGSH